jgi:hypothetical protein
MINKEDLLKDLFEKVKEIDEIFEEAGLSSLNTDCNDEDCDITEDDDIVTVFKLFQESYQLLSEYD